MDRRMIERDTEKISTMCNRIKTEKEGWWGRHIH